jgi:hypothetical protein
MTETQIDNIGVVSDHAMGVAYDIMEDPSDVTALESDLRQRLAIVDAELADLRQRKVLLFSDIKKRVRAKKVLERAVKVFADAVNEKIEDEADEP